MYCNNLLTTLWRQKFWNFEIIYLVKLFFFYMTKKWRQKFKYSEDKKSLRWNKKHFFIIFEGLSLKLIKQFFVRWESSLKVVLRRFMQKHWSLTEVFSELISEMPPNSHTPSKNGLGSALMTSFRIGAKSKFFHKF